MDFKRVARALVAREVVEAQYILTDGFARVQYMADAVLALVDVCSDEQLAVLIEYLVAGDDA